MKNLFSRLFLVSIVLTSYVEATSRNAPVGWSLLASTDKNQNIDCLLNQLNAGSVLWLFDKDTKKWSVKSNITTINTALAEHQLLSADTILPFNGFWLFNGGTNSVDVVLDCTLSNLSYTQVGLNSDDENLTLLRKSLAKTAGTLMQSILSINTFLFTDSNETNLTVFQARKRAVDQALDALIFQATQTEAYADGLIEPIAPLARSFSVEATPEEVEAILNSSKIKWPIKTLMQHYKVNAQEAKNILDNAMEGLVTKYTAQADFETQKILIAQTIRDGAALTVVIGTAAVTAGATGVLTGAQAVGTVISGSDAIVKLTKSGAELMIGQDGALDSAYNNSTLLRGLSDVNELISIQSLFSNPNNALELTNQFTWMAGKLSDLIQDKKITFGAESYELKSLDAMQLTSIEADLKAILQPSTYPGRFKFDSKAIETSTLPDVPKKMLKNIPDDKKTVQTVQEINRSWESWPDPQWCPRVYDSNIVNYLGRVYLNTKDYVTCSYNQNILSLEDSFINGQHTGMRKEYYTSGVLKTQAEYLNYTQINSSIEYYPSGAIANIIPYSNGIINGTSVGYYESGRMHHIFPFVNGKKDGEVKYFNDDDSGVLLSCAVYSAGIVIGSCP